MSRNLYTLHLSVREEWLTFVVRDQELFYFAMVSMSYFSVQAPKNLSVSPAYELPCAENNLLSRIVEEMLGIAKNVRNRIAKNWKE